MATEWFINDGSGVAVHTEDESMALIGDYIPDYVLIPNECPIRGGERARVIRWNQNACPGCKRTVRHLDLNGNLYVAQCKPGCGFLFYEFKSKES